MIWRCDSAAVSVWVDKIMCCWWRPEFAVQHHSLRHAFGTHLYQNGTDLLTIKALLGHKSIHSTVIYVHLAENGTGGAVSPFDRMGGARHAQA